MYVFIRHNFHRAVETERSLWADGPVRVGLGYTKKGWDPKVYPGREKAIMKRFVECQRRGAFVCTRYETFDIAAGKRMLFFGEIGGRGESERGEIPSVESGRTLKTLPLRLLGYTEARRLEMLQVTQPRIAAISPWPSMEDVLRCIEAKEPLKRVASSLSPSQQEVLCYEWLRWKGYLSCLLWPLGRTMEAVDIWGLPTNGRRNMLAQVTFNQNDRKIGEKLANLERARPRSDDALFFFCREDKIRRDSKVHFVAIESVFRDLDRHGSDVHRKMISAMIPDLSGIIAYTEKFPRP
jgi:hypothetical protein